MWPKKIMLLQKMLGHTGLYEKFTRQGRSLFIETGWGWSSSYQERKQLSIHWPRTCPESGHGTRRRRRNSSASCVSLHSTQSTRWGDTWILCMRLATSATFAERRCRWGEEGTLICGTFALARRWLLAQGTPFWESQLRKDSKVLDEIGMLCLIRFLRTLLALNS